MAWVTLCQLADLRENEGRFIEVAGRQLAVFRSGTQVHVMDNRCPHAGGSLSGGYIDHGCVVCPWHYWAFCLDTGRLNASDCVGIRIYPVQLIPTEHGETLVQADLPDPDPQPSPTNLMLE
jgi:nitrite reductase (NADH) small subunit/3-phenylpropionate/trans-cinnamate dioxygenase ferredoxin subunit